MTFPSTSSSVLSTGIEKTPSSVVNGFTTSGWTPIIYNAPVWAKAVLTGICTAATLRTILSITGAGQLNIVALRTVDVTARTMRVKITLDNVAVIDTTSASVSNTGYGGTILGLIDTTVSPSAWPMQSVSFASSCLIEFASSLTETDKCTFYLAYKLY